MEHHFDVKLAQKYGVIEAILLNHFEFWIQQNEANERNFYNGRYWTYNSLKAFCEIFPYLSEKQIRRALNKLQEEGILLVGNFNQNPYDRTLWYSLSEKGNSILPKGQMETAERANVQTAKRANGNCQKGRPIPDINTDINTDKKTSRFIKPTVEQVKAYCRERSNGVDAERFVDHYESNGWRVGKSPMKDWQAAVRTWERRDKDERGAGQGVNQDKDGAGAVDLSHVGTVV